ncbi:class I SAM-dependent RNA methyltransferase [Azovibrio restrictus]|uniref:THUMP domain-containing class I SAM-dependent RNA methyltransferase n=1 Tax=Azovibrio restrictus TaxID=146938 RepID=UPI00350E4D33
MEKFFATCPRGLEALLVDELQSAGAREARVVPGGVQFKGDWATCYRANLESRLATRILWYLARAPYEREEDIYRLALKQAWERHFDVFRTLRVQTTAIRCPLRSIDFVTLRVKDAICDRFRDQTGERPSIDTREPDVRVQVFLTERDCTLYLDTSGAPLWQRGLRHANVEAPLKENLAAGILKLSGWQPGTPLFDPMCGSGTFVLEAACMALKRAPGLERVRFGFEALKHHRRDVWQEIRNAALARVEEAGFQQIWASDVDERAVRATQRNLQQAGLGGVVEVSQQDFLNCTAPAPGGILVANPPYGERIGELNELAELYPAMSATLKRNFAGWTACFFTADSRFPKLLRLKPSRKTPLFNGALECRLYEIQMVAGSNRKPKAED